MNCCCDPDCGVLKDTFSCLPEGRRPKMPREGLKAVPFEGPASRDARYCYSKSWLRSVNPYPDSRCWLGAQAEARGSVGHH